MSPIHYAVVCKVVRFFFKKSVGGGLLDILRGAISLLMPFTNPETHAMGGRAVAAKLTPRQRREKALKAVRARIAKQAALKKAA